MAAGLVLLDGNVPYRKVIARLNELRQQHPGVRVLTKEIADTGTLVCYRMEIYHPDGHLWVAGHAEEARSANEINQVAATMNAETSSGGRALFHLARFGSEIMSAPVVEIDGTPYEKVESRMVRFRQQYADWTIAPQILCAGEILKLRTEIRSPDGMVHATGHAELRRGTNPNGKDLEEAETSAAGRALAFFGFAGDSVASAEEVLLAMRVQGRSPQVTVPPTPSTGYSVPTHAQSIAAALLRAGFSDVTHASADCVPPDKRFRLRQDQSAVVVDAQGDDTALQGLGFIAHPNGIWSLSVPAAAA